MQQPAKQGMSAQVIHRVSECLQRANSLSASCVLAPAPQMSQAVTQAPGVLCPRTARGYPAAAWATSLAMGPSLVVTGCSSGPITTTTSPVSPLSQLRYFRGELSDHCQPLLMSRSFSPIQSVELYPVSSPGGAESVPQAQTSPQLVTPSNLGQAEQTGSGNARSAASSAPDEECTARLPESHH